ncbi:DUF4062 domain-containing protein [Tissierella carlieri]|uniref:DUF4062 domain-containing protein n=1 Tax=Tissierella carlieri TaxID=689904 RepID=UPI001C11FBC1|nr:DUF4062 domain-containing protein [Tissierella carlieri]MBU5311898.1 DUF4062 domain-containing protein [Tissierella carlieri]
MNKKIYQVFVSSTYTDLKDERSAVEQVLISSDCLPIGMERFPSSNLEQFEYIKSVLKYVDYYILIIGGRYGTINEETGLSYTEMEYDFAVEQGIPILVFLKDDSAISIDKIDIENTDKLNMFINKVTNKRLRGNTFKDINELKVQVLQSITSEKNISPRPGWVRADFGDPMNLLLENNRLMKENEELKKQLEGSISIQELEREIKLLVLEGRTVVSDGPIPLPFFKKEREIIITKQKKEIVKILGDKYLKSGTLRENEISKLIVDNSNLKGSDKVLKLDKSSEEDINKILLINDIFSLDDTGFKITENGKVTLRNLEK